MKSIQRYLMALTAIALISTPLSAQTVVREVANGDLLVVNYSGKPPFKRQTVSRDHALYARYAALNESVMIASATTDRAGPPGKSLPAQSARMERIPEAEITRFARFEETDRAGQSRMWRGAPGKGRR